MIKIDMLVYKINRMYSSKIIGIQLLAHKIHRNRIFSTHTVLFTNNNATPFHRRGVIIISRSKYPPGLWTNIKAKEIRTKVLTTKLRLLFDEKILMLLVKSQMTKNFIAVGQPKTLGVSEFFFFFTEVKNNYKEIHGIYFCFFYLYTRAKY